MGHDDGTIIIMRVTTGSAKGRNLLMVPGDGTRPITDRAKQALFSILGDWIEETRVLDLFAGTGGIGIEALSRGAEHAVFIDLNRKATDTVTANLRNTRLEKQATVERTDSFLFLERYRGKPFHFIYVAPPQYQGMWHKALLIIDQRPDLLAKYGVVIVQIHHREEIPLTLTHLEEYDRRKYGSVTLIFYANAQDLAEETEEEDEIENDETDEFEDDDFEDGDLEDGDLEDGDDDDLDDDELDDDESEKSK